VFTWVMGITHHRHGTDSVRAIANLALLRGMVGRPGAGLLPLRGHSNIQGLGTVGVVPNLKPELAAAITRRLGIAIPATAGMDTLRSLEAADQGRIRCAWALGGNLYGASPDAAWAGRALGAIDQVVYLNTTLNTGHIHGRGRETWILPVRARDEEREPTTQESMFSFVRLSDGGPQRIAGARGEAELIGAIAARALPGHAIDWHDLARHQRLREAMADTVPGLDAMRDLAGTKAEFHIPGRAVAAPRFATPDGRARLIAVSPPPPPRLAADQLRVTTIRSEGQFNSVVYEDHDRYRAIDRRDVIMMSEADMRRLGLVHDSRVDLSSSVGAWRGVRVRAIPIAPGNAALYYPEANVLVPRDPDPDSGTPGFKSVVVTITLAR
jgi:molybdopterin-dependent oxidoreductase alpha subunit